MHTFIKNSLSSALVVTAALGTGWAVRHFHRPGQLDVVSAQAMDMSAMRPPTGAALVSLGQARRGTAGEVVTYTGTVRAWNEQDIAPRIVGTLLTVPVYPGDRVRQGQLIAQLDSAELSAKTAQAVQEAQGAQAAAQVAQVTRRLHQQATVDMASRQLEAATAGVSEAQAQAQAASDMVPEAKSALQSAQANAAYWQTEIVREKGLADAGAASRQEYQSEFAQAQAAQSGVAGAQAKVRQARADADAAQARARQAGRQAEAARDARRVAEADLVVAAGQTAQAQAGAGAARDAAREAAIVSGYARIVSPAGGVVVSRPVAPGTLVQPGMTILRIAEIDRVRVQAHVAAADLAHVRVGAPVQIISQGGGNAQPISARVTSVFPAADEQTRTAIVEAVVANPQHRLLPGAFVTMRLATSAPSRGLLVPASALVSSGGAPAVWVAQTAGDAAGARPAVYECQTCHMRFSAAQAKKNHYRDTMDGGRLVLVSSPGGTGAGEAGAMTAHAVAVRAGASDGASVEVTGAGLGAGQSVVTHGQAGLTEGVRIAAVPWSSDGPQTLPLAASAQQGVMVYRCEKCGMTYSAADARRHHFIDPMDGGTLTPVGGK